MSSGFCFLVSEAMILLALVSIFALLLPFRPLETRKKYVLSLGFSFAAFLIFMGLGYQLQKWESEMLVESLTGVVRLVDLLIDLIEQQ